MWDALRVVGDLKGGREGDFRKGYQVPIESVMIKGNFLVSENYGFWEGKLRAFSFSSSNFWIGS